MKCYFVYADQYNQRRLIRNVEYMKWHLATFRRNPINMNRPKIISNLKEVNECLAELNAKTFRGFKVVGIDMEFTNVHHKPYEAYPAREKMFECNQYPTHKDFPFSIVRWILLSSPYGDNFIIDAAKMTPDMLSIFEKFTLAPDTVLVAFNWQSDAWAYHLTFGRQKFPFSIYKKMSKKAKAEYREESSKAVRVFDMYQVLEALEAGAPAYNVQDWHDLGMIPEGKSLWHLAQATIGIDLIGNDTTSVRDISEYWNVKALDTTRIKYMQIDMQATIQSFFVLYRYGLFYDACQLIGGFPHDSQKFINMTPNQSRMLCNEDVEEVMASEVLAFVNIRDDLSTIERVVPYCYANVMEPGKKEQLAMLKYEPGTYPKFARKKAAKAIASDSESEVDLDAESETEDEAEAKPKDANREKSEITNFKSYLEEWDAPVPGDMPFFIAVTSPRSRTECYRYIKEVQEFVRNMWHTNDKKKFEEAKQICARNGLMDDGSIGEGIKKNHQSFSTRSHSKRLL